MEKFDFDKIINRRGTNCYKYDEMPNDDTIPLWVADMDFETAPVVQKALKERMEHGCFGYTMVPESFYESTIDWFQRRHHWTIERSWFIYTSGVVPAVSAIIKAMTKPGDEVLVQTPVYNCFFSSIRNNDCVVNECPLTYEDNTYTIDFDAFEKQCARSEVKVFLLCNPHNPAGRVWTKDELQRMGEICKRHDVFVIADEIHCEFVNDCHYTPFASVSDAPCAVCISPSKAFNIAGLQIANIIIKDADVRRRVDKAININEVCDVNPFGVIALQAAYTPEGEEWLSQLNDYIYANYDFACEFIAKHLPQWKVTKLEGTYLLWVDVSATGMNGDDYAQYLLLKHNVFVNKGSAYGKMAGEKFIRINLATQRVRLEEALKRIVF
ncbi:MAG: pyridoxal phosphate-dependent aminotransferase [Prevotella sp.]|nr:pyridoxal phosphate-dependent aminotransferase [Candidatus Prevotella equi]